MSKYKVISTEFRQAEHLIAALKECGVSFETCKDLRSPSLNLIGYQNDVRPEMASIVIRKDEVNRIRKGYASNDIGFSWNGKEFAAIVSEFDQGQDVVRELMTNLRKVYAHRAVLAQARARGYTTQEHRLPDGSIQIQLIKR